VLVIRALRSCCPVRLLVLALYFSFTQLNDDMNEDDEEVGSAM